MMTIAMQRKGYTLTELLIAVTILIIVLASVLLYLDPIGRVRLAHNAKRQTDVEAIANAVALMKFDDPASFYSAIGNIAGGYFIITSTAQGNCPGEVCQDKDAADGNCTTIGTLTSSYLPSLPFDPEFGNETTGITGYYIGYIDKSIIVGACLNTGPDINNELPTIEVIL